MTIPEVIVFDVNETLSDMKPLGTAFTEAGLPAYSARIWFTEILRDGFAIATTGGNTPFAEIAEDSLRRLMAEQHAFGDGRKGLEHIIDTMKNLTLHADAVPGIEALSRIADLVTLSNGATTVADTLLTQGGVREHFSRLLSVNDAPAWKPAASAYNAAAEACGTKLQEMLLVAVHPWDIHGANTAGMQTAWLNRTGSSYPAYFTRPSFEAPDLPTLAEHLS